MLIGTATYTPLAYSVRGEIFATPYVSVAEAAVVDYTHMTEGDILELIHRYAPKKKVKEKSVLLTIECEAQKNSDGTFNATGQSNFYNKAGVRESSWGLSQINLPSHPNVSKAQAQDPDFAVSFIVDGFATGQEGMWTCWRDLKAAGKI